MCHWAPVSQLWSQVGSRRSLQPESVGLQVVAGRARRCSAEPKPFGAFDGFGSVLPFDGQANRPDVDRVEVEREPVVIAAKGDPLCDIPRFGEVRVAENTTLKQRVHQLTQDNRVLDERLNAARFNLRFLDRRLTDLEAKLLESPT